MWVLIVLILSWFLFSLLEGLTEARLWHHKYKVFDERVVNKFDSHTSFAIQRGVVILFMCIVVHLYADVDSLVVSLLFFIASALTFSFLHNGMMYTHRNQLSKMTKGDEIYPKKWFDQSKTSSAFTTKFMTPVSRTLQFVFGVILYVVIISVYF